MAKALGLSLESVVAGFLHNNLGLMGGSGGNWQSQGVRCRREEDKEIGEKDDGLVES